MSSVNTQRLCIFIFGDLLLIPIVQSKLIICNTHIARHLVDSTSSVTSTNGGFFYAIAPVIVWLTLDHPHTFVHYVHYVTCPLTCIHSSFMSERDKQVQEHCADFSHYEPHHTIQQDVISTMCHRLSFHLWGTSPCLFGSLFDSVRDFLWHQNLTHCSEHTIPYVHHHVDRVSKLSNVTFNVLNHCATCLQATLTNSSASHHSFRDSRTTLYQGLFIFFGLPKNNNIMAFLCLPIEELTTQQACFSFW